jgi:hypothetical protein
MLKAHVVKWDESIKESFADLWSRFLTFQGQLIQSPCELIAFPIAFEKHNGKCDPIHQVVMVVVSRVHYSHISSLDRIGIIMEGAALSLKDSLPETIEESKFELYSCYW